MPVSVLDILSQDYQSQSLDNNQSRLVNMYLEADENKGEFQVIALPTPGLTTFTTLATSPVRGMYEEHGVLYAVGGNTAYSIASNGTATTLGTLTTSTGVVNICGINAEIMFTDGTNGYIWNITKGTWTAIPTLSAGGLVASVTVATNGSNYTNATCTISFSGGGGSGAAAVPVIIGGEVTAINVTAAGSGYTAAPTVIVNDSGTGSGATATATISTNAFPATCTATAAQDEFFMTFDPGSQIWQISNISDGLTWQPLNFASTTGQQNNLTGIATLMRQIYLFGETSTEVWYNAGAVNFPFLRRPDAFIEWGCAATNSIAKGNNTLWFLAQNANGGPVIVKLQGYTPQVISNAALNYQLQTYATISDAIGFLYEQAGHMFYVLTFPTQGVTWVWDDTTQTWHERQSYISGGYTRWTPSCNTFCYNLPLVGDSQSGNIYKLDLTNYTENGTAIQRLLQTHPFYAEDQFMFIGKLRLNLDTTAGASLSNVNLSVSRSYQPTFGTAKPAVPQSTDYGYRIYWNQLGRARVFSFQIQTTMNAKFAILGAFANIVTGGMIKNMSGM